MESSKATDKHIRQVTGDLPAAQIHLMHHQHTELLAGNYNKHKKMTKQRPQNHRPTEQTSKKSFDLQKPEKPSDRCIRCSDTSHTKGFQCPAKKFQCKTCHKFSHFTSVCYQMNHQTSGTSIPKKPKAHQLQAWALYTHQDADGTILEESSSDEWLCLQMKVQKTINKSATT